ncbi:GbsR/MarR family transcriptional regulator [Cesiribacter sp. SM1]|uniref:GbsR/MarR family transcriptional regulator n=1 Tax=Cesiribacter sp. SM1 TaxID=2861196 RepID=UPI001CD3FA72|nr:MarR family transcriptional regulator [Cesiribacter sp. SM1]
MTELKLSEEQKALIEELGVFHEQNGLQPAAARIISLLLIADKTELTFDEIREALNLSKSATSYGLNFLLSINRIDYITLPGDRKRYFRTRLVTWEKEVHRHLESMLKGNLLLKKVLNQRTPETESFNNKLQEVIEFMEYLEKELPLVVQRWHDTKKKPE